MRSRRPASHQRSVFQPREPAFWVFAAFLVYGVITMLRALGQLSAISRSGWALSWLLLALYAAPLFLLIYYLDLYEREPVSVAVAAFLWGAFAATALALDAGGWDEVLARLTDPTFAARWGPALTAPIVEEFLKGAGLVLLYLIVRDEVDDVMDGFVYGALCGLGFAVVEDVAYFMAAFGGTPGGVLEGFYVRVLSSGLYGHVLYTGLVGMAIGYVVSRRDPSPLRARLPVAAGLVALAVIGHVLWNAPLPAIVPTPPIEGAEWVVVPVVLAIKGLPLLLLVVVALRLARARERRWLDGALAGEVGLDGVSAKEFEILRVPAERRAAIRAMRRRAGTSASRLLARLQREQIDLAMIAARMASDDPRLLGQRDYCRSLRDALAAMPGATPPSRPRASLPPMDVAALIEGVLAREPRAVARSISLVEDGHADLAAVSAGLYEHTGTASTIGLTGPPGVGKSTIATSLVRSARAAGKRIAVLAIDPTSPYTGGALLGDRVRMQEHATDPDVFIRSMATRGHLGGMALAAPEAVRILDAAGYDLVIVETVGVGQAEVDVAAATDTALVVLAPGLGDAVQLAKAGILEVADIFVVNKADRDGTAEVVRGLQQMLHLGAARPWDPPILTSTATEGEGIDGLWAAIDRHRAWLVDSGGLDAKRNARIVAEVGSLAAERFKLSVTGALANDGDLAQRLRDRRIDPYVAATELLRRVPLEESG